MASGGIGDDFKPSGHWLVDKLRKENREDAKEMILNTLRNLFLSKRINGRNNSMEEMGERGRRTQKFRRDQQDLLDD